VSSRALVLGGGGVAGIAWETGLLAGLLEHGIDLVRADLIVGTSAGATVAAQITAAVPLADLLTAQLDPSGGAEIPVSFDLRQWLVDFRQKLAGVHDSVEARRRLGEFALKARTVEEPVRRAVIEARLPRHEWPEQPLKLTAADALTGEFVIFDRDSGVTLVDAVGASCAVPGIWPPVTIDGRRYIDGGVRSATNTDIAYGYDEVLVLQPLELPEGRDVRPLGEASRVTVVRVSPAGEEAMGANPLDPAARPAAARAGHEQAAQVAPELHDVWAVRV
jgi:NTE family protein